RQLNYSRRRVRRATRAGNLAESSSCDARVRITEESQVRNIEPTRTKLEPPPFIYVGDFTDTDVHIRSRWSAKCIPTQRTVGSLRRVVHRIKALSDGRGECCSRKRTRIQEVVALSSVDRLRHVRIEVGYGSDQIRSQQVLVAYRRRSGDR